MHRAKRSNNGMTFIEVLIVVAFTLLWFLGISVAMELVKGTEGNLIVMAACATCIVVIAIGLFFKAKSDSYSASMYSAVLSLVAAITLWVIFFGVGKLETLAAAAVATIATVAGFAWMRKISKMPEQFPSTLWEKFDKKKIYEMSGVQFAAEAPETINAGASDFIHLYVQNCWDTPRTFVVSANGGKGLVYHGQTQITFEGIVAGILHIPFAALSEAKGRNQLRFIPSVAGKGGKRVRRKRARDISTQGSAMAAKLLFGVLGALLVKPGLKIPITISPNPNVAPAGSQVELPAATWEEIFKPEDHHFIKPIG